MSLQNPNPYESSAVDAVLVEQSGQTIWEIARPIFVAWERLRLIYLAIMIPSTLLMVLLSFEALSDHPMTWIIAIVMGGLFANVCYFAGPIVETYVTWLGIRLPWLRLVTFVLGTILTLLLAAAMMLEMILMP